MIEARKIAEVMGLGARVRSLHDLEASVSRGLPKGAIRKVAAHVEARRADQTCLIYKVIPAATYKRRKKNLSPSESARTERLARIIATAEYVWDDEADARRFLTTPHTALRGERPIDVARTELGARAIEELLWKLFHGLPV
jgi:putative toxin-antitoxin system antitoxin component (TIGR02293 family)